MSAYVVTREHIDYLLHAALGGPPWKRGLYWWHGQSHRLEGGDDEQAVRVGQMLWDENVRSVSHRYPNADEDFGGLPGPVDERYVYDKHRDPWCMDGTDWVQVLKSIACYEYQSCEHDGWKDSEAYAFCQSLRGKAITMLAGFEDAAWGAPKTPAERRAETRAKMAEGGAA